MVYLSRIYTKTGDQGETSLGDGARLAKDHPRVEAMGEVDELNALLGLVLAESTSLEPDLDVLLRGIQNDLFDVGADLCLPWVEGEKVGEKLRIRVEQAQRLEASIDHYNASLEPLKSFILPGGSRLSAWCHLARTICRRAERRVVTLTHDEKLNPQVIIYLNRLSDLLFVLARHGNRQGQDDVLWVPGQGA